MKIAQVAPLFESVPPKAYGGTERVVAYLTDALMALGHEVTLFASGDSVTAAKLVPIVPQSLRLDPRHPDWLAWHLIMIDRVFEAAEQFDVIHFHVDYLHVLSARVCRRPCVTTVHGRLDSPDLAAFLQHFGGQNLITISDSQRAQLSGSGWRATVHHGLPADLYSFHPEAHDYFAFVGRISPEKRVDRAIEIAIACGVRLRIAAKVDAFDQKYFDTAIRPLLIHPLVEYVGEIGEAQKNDFIGNARALLFPIDWPEPFGLVMIEAFACGTPVVAYRCGAVSEIMVDGVTGFVVDDLQGAISAARAITDIDRRGCRRVFEQRYTSLTMARRYVEAYRSLPGSATAATAAVQTRHPAEPSTAAPTQVPSPAQPRIAIQVTTHPGTGAGSMPGPMPTCQAEDE